MKIDEKVIIKNFRIVMPILLSSLIFILIYPSAEYLPVLGDGTHHARIMEEIVNKQSLDIDTIVYYPIIYHLFGAIIYIFEGILGIKMISPIMMTLSGLVVYLIGRDLTKSEFVGLLSIVLIAFSPKVIWYGAQIIMEPFLIFSILISVYTAILFLNKKIKFEFTILALMVANAVSIKQMGLVIFITIIITLSLAKITFKKLLLFSSVVMFLVIVPYLHMYEKTDVLVAPPAGNINYLSNVDENNILYKVLYLDGWNQIPDWSKELDNELNNNQLFKQGNEAHESRKITPLNLLEFDNFFMFHILYMSKWVGYEGSKNRPLLIVLEASFIVGFIVLLYNSIGNNNWRLITILIITSYFFTFIGNDPKRYFLYIPTLLSFITLIPIYKLIKIFKNNNIPNYIYMLYISSVIFILFIYIFPVGIETQNHVQGLERTQAYGPSKSGIVSLINVSEWIKKNSNSSDIIMNSDDYEFAYYTKMDVIYDWRLYFLPEDRILYYLKNFYNPKFIIIKDNEIVNIWNNIQKIPIDSKYYQLITTSKNFKLVYNTEDIRVYEFDPIKEV